VEDAGEQTVIGWIEAPQREQVEERGEVRRFAG
jgi:hypothetical protein